MANWEILTDKQFLKLNRKDKIEYREHEKRGWLKQPNTECWSCGHDAGRSNVNEDGTVFCDDYPNCAYGLYETY